MVLESPRASARGLIPKCLLTPCANSFSDDVGRIERHGLCVLAKVSIKAEASLKSRNLSDSCRLQTENVLNRLNCFCLRDQITQTMQTVTEDTWSSIELLHLRKA